MASRPRASSTSSGAIPVVFLTANADQATFERACSTAPYGYVLKPFSQHDLLMALDLARQRARIDADLRQHSLTFEAISAAVADGIVVTDGDGHVRYCNPAAEQLLDFPLNVAVGRLYADVAPTLQPRDALTDVARPAEATLIAGSGELFPCASCARRWSILVATWWARCTRSPTCAPCTAAKMPVAPATLWPGLPSRRHPWPWHCSTNRAN